VFHRLIHRVNAARNHPLAMNRCVSCNKRAMSHVAWPAHAAAHTCHEFC
jgi:hypothetical protein